MRPLFAAAALAAILLCPAAAHADCRQKAISILRTSSPDGYAIYTQTTPEFFGGWIDCADAEYDLSTAVHESTHYVTGETDAFPLVGGGAVARPHAVSGLMPPWRIAAQFGHDSFTDIYLKRGKASSATDFLYLLDELNAYSHDLAAAVDLQALRSHEETVDHRDGLAALMAFTAAYAETARAQDARDVGGPADDAGAADRRHSVVAGGAGDGIVLRHLELRGGGQGVHSSRLCRRPALGDGAPHRARAGLPDRLPRAGCRGRGDGASRIRRGRV